MANKYKKIKLKDGTTRDEHRIIMENHLGRKLTFNEVVHHINGNKFDNRLENLELMSRSEHVKHHYKTGGHHMFTKEDRAKSILKIIENNHKRRLPHAGDYYTCSKCKTFKHRDNFNKHKSKWNGLQSFCKECVKCSNSSTGRTLAL